MATRVKHAYNSAVGDGGATQRVRPSNWNADHDIILSAMLALLDPLSPAADKLIWFPDANTAAMATITAVGRALIAASDAASACAAIGALATTGGTMTGALNVISPSSASNAASKAYVDSVASGLKPKASVRAASTANVSISSAPASLDGITGVSNDRWLLKNQTAPAENGIYVFSAAAAALVRADDFNAWTEIPGANLWVEEGSTNADTAWVCTSNQGGTLGSTAVTFVQFWGSGLYQPLAANLTTLAALSSVANLSALAGLTGAANRIPGFTGAGAMALLTHAQTAGANVVVQANGSGFIDSTFLPTVVSPNLADNDSFEIDQRYVGAATAISDNNYWADRWRYIGEASANCTARAAGVAGVTAFGGTVSFTGTTDKGGIFQVKEGRAIKNLRGQSVVLSAYLAVNNVRLGTMKMALLEFTGTEDATTGDPVTTWGAAGTNPTLAAGWAYITTGGTPVNLNVTTSAVRYSVTGTVGASANNLAILIWNDDKTYNASDNFSVYAVKLEPGSSPTTYYPKDRQALLAECERFYEKSYNELTAVGANTANGDVEFRANGTLAFSQVRFKTRKRAGPTVTVFSTTSGATGVFRNATAGTDVTANLISTGESGFNVEAAAGVADNDRCALHFTAVAEI